MTMPDGIELRCSAIVVRKRTMLLLHRTSGADDWVLPGGTPRPGESMAACTRTVDIVFSAADPAPDRQPEQREPGLVPVFVPVDRIHELDLRPPLAGHLRAMLGGRRELYAPYLANLWRSARGPA
jgi:8-oxo-dGTP diphosphatase